MVWRTVILAAGALLLIAEGKSIKKPHKLTRSKRSPWGTYGVDKRDELLNALNGLERERRRYETPNQYINPMAYLFDGSLTQDNDPGYYEREDSDNPMRKKSDDYAPFRAYPRPADLTELEDILASDTKAKAKKSDWGSSEESDLDSNYMPEPDSGEVEDTSEEVNPARTEFTREQLEALLRKAEEFQREALDEDEEEAAQEEEQANTAEPVSKEELESVLAGDDKSEETSEKEEEKEKEEEEAEESNKEVQDWRKYAPKMPDLNKEWLINQYLKAAGEEVTKKHKRVAKRQGMPPIEAQEEEEEMAEEDAEKYTKEDLENLVEQYAIENKLVTKENEFLATALNAATLGQIEKTDRYLGQQYKALQNAVKVEEALQNIETGDVEEVEEEEEDKRVVKKDDFEDAEGLQDLPDDMPVSQVKEMPMKDQGEWFDQPLPEGYDLIDENSPEFRTLNPFLRKMIKTFGPEKTKEMLSKRGGELAPIEIEEEEIPSDEEIEEAVEQTEREAEEAQNEEEEAAEEEEEEEENEIASTLGQLISNLAPEEKVQLKQQIADIVGNPKDVCPAVETLGDGCDAIMKLYGVDLDDEARSVCSRHKVCYACGSSIDETRLSPDECDKIFLRDAERLCRGVDSCKDGASGLFLLMDREHSYIEEPSDTTTEICNRKCVARYILGLE